jgi:hypothetical protein
VLVEGPLRHRGGDRFGSVGRRRLHLTCGKPLSRRGSGCGCPAPDLPRSSVAWQLRASWSLPAQAAQA